MANFRKLQLNRRIIVLAMLAGGFIFGLLNAIIRPVLDRIYRSGMSIDGVIREWFPVTGPAIRFGMEDITPSVSAAVGVGK